MDYVWDEDIFQALTQSLMEASSRDVDVRLALNPALNTHKEVGRGWAIERSLRCECNLVVVDDVKMLTITHTKADTYYTIITTDPGMVSLATSYY